MIHQIHFRLWKFSTEDELEILLYNAFFPLLNRLFSFFLFSPASISLLL